MEFLPYLPQFSAVSPHLSFYSFASRPAPPLVASPAINSALERALKPFPSLPAPCDWSGPIRQVAFPRQSPEVLRPHEPDCSKLLASAYSGDSAHHRYKGEGAEAPGVVNSVAE
jgi:hypothetical protein